MEMKLNLRQLRLGNHALKCTFGDQDKAWKKLLASSRATDAGIRTATSPRIA